MLKVLHRGINEKQAGHLGYPQYDDKVRIYKYKQKCQT